MNTLTTQEKSFIYEWLLAYFEEGYLDLDVGLESNHQSLLSSITHKLNLHEIDFVDKMGLLP